MKKLVLFLLLTQILDTNLFGQFQPILDNQNALIIKKSNDSINCLLHLYQINENELSPSDAYASEVSYQLPNSTKVQSMKIKEIKSIKTVHSTYITLPINRQDQLFKVSVDGNMSLLEWHEISIVSNLYSDSRKSYSFGPPKILYYAIITNGEVHLINQKKDLKFLLPILETCPEAKSLFGNKAFKLNDLKSLVTMLNCCK